MIPVRSYIISYHRLGPPTKTAQVKGREWFDQKTRNKGCINRSKDGKKTMNLCLPACHMEKVASVSRMRQRGRRHLSISSVPSFHLDSLQRGVHCNSNGLPPIHIKYLCLHTSNLMTHESSKEAETATKESGTSRRKEEWKSSNEIKRVDCRQICLPNLPPAAIQSANDTG
ncbi:hypothetical protein BDB00DRAFT_836155 [Zychaea mexicana]|uniref:uncharacterized protein n=1 Tax=Zychaea mexicana TaxID=64656 RepID=UPI0022FE52F3|nr:uncharacterized protein BDB00DRAFT_836155 [Zychaea mexicana]KAI9490792.1 hypothetical protein BDB00DRAFT_836155 [Zychaea mexicana]